MAHESAEAMDCHEFDLSVPAVLEPVAEADVRRIANGLVARMRTAGRATECGPAVRNTSRRHSILFAGTASRIPDMVVRTFVVSAAAMVVLSVGVAFLAWHSIRIERQRQAARSSQGGHSSDEGGVGDASSQTTGSGRRVIAGSVELPRVGNAELVSFTSVPSSVEMPGDMPIHRYTVRQGDNLSSVASRFLGSPAHWRHLWAVNRETVCDPDHLKAGQILIIPDIDAVASIRVP